VESAWRAGALPLVKAALLGGKTGTLAGQVADLRDILQAHAVRAADAAMAALVLEDEAEREEAKAPRKSKKKRNKHLQKAAVAAPRETSAGTGATAAEATPQEVEAHGPQCVICLDAQPCVLLLPCRHLPLCGSAACAAMLGAPPRCPLCRVAVADTMSVFPL
jgi:hypothetical protein